MNIDNTQALLTVPTDENNGTNLNIDNVIAKIEDIYTNISKNLLTVFILQLVLIIFITFFPWSLGHSFLILLINAIIAVMISIIECKHWKNVKSIKLLLENLTKK